MSVFYENVGAKVGRKMHLQNNQEFLQNEIKRLNLKRNVKMLNTRMRDEKAFVIKQKIREKNNCTKLKLSQKELEKSPQSIKLFAKATNNMNKSKSEKYSLEPEVRFFISYARVKHFDIAF